VVRHQAVGPDGDALLAALARQQAAVEVAVLVAEEHPLAPVATLMLHDGEDLRRQSGAMRAVAYFLWSTAKFAIKCSCFVLGALLERDVMSGAADRKIGLALSGGGSRAIAFHLGCLRALNRIGLLNCVSVFSTVSGGSIIGAYYQVHQGDFPSFETKVRELLALGLANPMMKKLFSKLGIKVLRSFVVTGLIAVGVALLRMLFNFIRSVTPSWIAVKFGRVEIRSPLHRFASRTSLLEGVLDDILFKGVSLASLPRRPHLIINATELRTGSAFRFGTLESGSWRWGKLHRNQVSLAHAVAASAAYPLFLPAFDETLTFEKGGELRDSRVVLTDGGVYDNLGLGCLWPDRSRDISLNVFPVDTIICCFAGYGLRQDPPSQFIFARMLSVFSTTFDRAQNAAIGRLHDMKEAGKIKNFILPHLGQLDAKLPNPPSDLVRREEAHAYPTDFNAMTADWIERLSLRGEQLTLCLARAYIPELCQQVESPQ
jgi:NTE family protein